MTKSLRVQIISYTVLAALPASLWIGGFINAKRAYAADYEAKRPTINSPSRGDAYRRCHEFIHSKRVTEGWSCKEYDEAFELMDSDLYTPMARWASGTRKGDVLHNYPDIGMVVPTLTTSVIPYGGTEGPTFYFSK